MPDIDPHQQKIRDFLVELTGEMDSHACKRWGDAWLHQSLVIGAAIAGFLSLALGLGLWSDAQHDYRKWAGIVGALTSVATILSQQLNCVKAINWHERMRVELDGIRLQLVYEHESNPNHPQLAGLSKQLRHVKLKMAREWEKATRGPEDKTG